MLRSKIKILRCIAVRHILFITWKPKAEAIFFVVYDLSQKPSLYSKNLTLGHRTSISLMTNSCFDFLITYGMLSPLFDDSLGL